MTTATPPKPAALPVLFHAIPDSLQRIDRWVGWKWDYRPNNAGVWTWTKPPLQPGGANAAVDNPATWRPLAVIKAAYEASEFDGGGIVLTKGGGLTGVDWDKCIDPETNEIDIVALLDARRLNTYTERSPSNRGLRAFIEATMPARAGHDGTGRNWHPIRTEAYTEGRFLTVTGHILEGAPVTVEPRQDVLDQLIIEWGERNTAAKQAAKFDKDAEGKLIVNRGFTDDELLRRMCAAQNGKKYRRLMLGNWQAAGFTSQSDADAALVEGLLFYGCKRDPAAVDRLVRRTLLYREKWDRADYRKVTYDAALAWVKAKEGRTEDPGEAPPQRPASSADGDTDGNDTAADMSDDRHAIRVDDRNFDELVDEAFSALAASNDPPTIFVRGGQLVRVCRDEEGRPVVSALTVDSLRTDLARAARWYQVLGKARKPYRESVAPPSEVVRSILARGEWPSLPALAGITQTPVLHADGSIHAGGGYDRVSHLWYAPAPGFTLPPLPGRPDRAAVQAAVAVINDVYADFPFLTDADRSAMWASLFTAVQRALIDGQTPIHIINKPRAGTGASLLAETVAVIATGANAQMKTLAKDRGGEETRKAITSALLAGDSMIVFDNVDVAIESGHLAAAVTAHVWQDRLLGTMEMVRLPVQVHWMATGNNIRVRGDIARRSVVCRLDAQVERPWERTDFRHPQLLAFVTAERGPILAAIFTIVRAWIQAGRPAGDNPTLGSFEAWSRFIGGILQFAGVPDFLANLSEFYAAADEEWAEWAGFLELLKGWFKGGPFTVAELAHDLGDAELGQVLRDQLPVSVAASLGKPSFRHILGRALASKEEARFDGLRLIKAGEIRRAIKWLVVADAKWSGNPTARKQTCESGESGESVCYSTRGGNQDGSGFTDEPDSKQTHQTHQTHTAQDLADELRPRAYVVAKRAGFPALSLPPDIEIVGSMDAWGSFLWTASVENMQRAMDALKGGGV